MYIRPEAKIRIPENYSGNMFSGGISPTDIPPNEKEPINLSSDHPKSEPYIGNSDIIENVPDTSIVNKENEKREIDPGITYYNENTIENNRDDTKTCEDKKKSEIVPAVHKSLFSTLLPSGSIASHFPFGHGIGIEELLIIGMMLMVYLSRDEENEVDGELIMLLAILLFAG